MTLETDTAFGRALEFERQTLALLGGELSEIPEGWLARTPSLPLVSSLNNVEVTRSIDPADAVALVERHSSGLPFRQLRAHGGDGEGLAPELGAQGWRVERHLVMSLHGEPDRALDTSGVIEAPEPEALELMRDWVGEGEHMRDPEVRDQTVEACRRTWRAREARRFGVLDGTGALAGMTMLFSDGALAQVEDVYVAPSKRGRGLGRVLVTHAAIQALEAGHALVFLVADDDGWPKHLYASVGFEPAGRTWVFDRSA